MQILLGYLNLVLHHFLYRVSLATIGVCIFCAFASVGALFVLWGELCRLIEGGLLLIIPLFHYERKKKSE